MEEKNLTQVEDVESLTKGDITILLALICDEQTRFIKRKEYESDRYVYLERLKSKLRDVRDSLT